MLLLAGDIVVSILRLVQSSGAEAGCMPTRSVKTQCSYSSNSMGLKLEIWR